jgi:hypothetical protein
MPEQIEFHQIRKGDRLIVALAGRNRFGIHVSKVYRFAGLTVVEGRSISVRHPYRELGTEKWLNLMEHDVVERLSTKEVAA